MALQSKFLLQFLTECLQTERSGQELYEGAIARATDEDIKRELFLFKDQTVRHVEIVENLIRHFGGSVPKLQEAMADLMGKLTSGMSALQGTGDYQKWKDLDNLLLAEQKCNSNWQVLRTVSETMNDPVLTQAVQQVLGEEDRHVEWLNEQVLRLAPRAVTAG